MVCKRCKKECLESELKNGICKECETKDKNTTFKMVTISVIISVILTLAITAWANNDASLSDFKIESFNMETEKITSNDLTYNGKGIISCKNKENNYMVLVEKKNKRNSETEYIPIVIHNGVGELSTYDSSYLGTTEKPEYEFNIIGYRSFRKN